MSQGDGAFGGFAAGQDATVTVTTPHRVKAVTGVFQCAAAVANRMVQFQVVNSLGRTVFLSPVVASQVATQIKSYNAAPLLSYPTADVAGVFNIAFPDDLVMQVGWIYGFVTLNIQGADQWTAFNVLQGLP